MIKHGPKIYFARNVKQGRPVTGGRRQVSFGSHLIARKANLVTVTPIP